MSYQVWHDIIGGNSSILLIVDHASAFVPEDIDLGIDKRLYDEHVAVDKGVQTLGEQLCQALQCNGVFAAQSRLVVDLNRDENDFLGLMPAISDGYVIHGNTGLTADEKEARLSRFYRPYHQHIDDIIQKQRPRLIISLHSFTPCLKSDLNCYRPWQIGLLYNNDDRATQIAIPLLKQAHLVVGENEPYSGRILNTTMNRHAENNRIPYLLFEIRQDMLEEANTIGNWCAILKKVINETLISLKNK
ncbi:N-formylglutamate amidohydrolase [Zymomonas mobilis]|uniref:N-formylglutamate amidohydrolase n=1 Tax=Zymomonas mobilis subsp. mobilis (strain ATCC 10988 / DSM 424 / LMG 404 / NCIMB 8938 / NRRL B-806 / ZM1) TaxID=555217 RepID=A0A0H3G021_ZYMMA|nr:N-formylglutamate amidohydrolase [Zymomonas mobilis]AEH62002.1 N-formylglutamate amidohydrolase [Zymomonas mobilis subsp. mobilis ATCC 10988]MCP9307774.1 N-formylglutamate amidohydrolase [Zymomonas mobilis]TQL28403.1 N-formylglutamate deformylase [Zymomonas mobilis]TQL30339.1 N-formylglutamate deformylase [Zymomonas mobilis]